MVVVGAERRGKEETKKEERKYTLSGNAFPHFGVGYWLSCQHVLCVHLHSSHVFGEAAEGARPEKRLGVNFCAVKLTPPHPLINGRF